jgi:hypothetical protein
MIELKRATAMTLVLVVAGMLSACDPDTLLQVERPDLVTPDDIQGAKGAELLSFGALGQFQDLFDVQVRFSGLLSDELQYTGLFPPLIALDARSQSGGGFDATLGYSQLHQARVSLENAAVAVEESLPGDDRLAQMHALAGYAYILFGEHFCSGVPFGQTTPSGVITQGVQQTTEQTFGLALEKFSAATQAAAGTMELEYLAAAGAARALVDIGRYAAAAAQAATVPTDWVYLLRYQAGAEPNQENDFFKWSGPSRELSLSDQEGGNGLPFRTDTDARVPWTTDGMNGADNVTPYFTLTKYTSLGDDIVLASGIEARLIEAEAALEDGDVVLMMTRLNDLRATLALGDLTDPGTVDGRVDMLFSERARWMFATAHRLGDMRRLVEQYGRDAESVFPVGPHHRGGFYGTEIEAPIPDREDFNPNFSGCFSRGG